MKVLMINGSPRAQGCTYTALMEVAGVLEGEGISTELIQLGVTPIRGCTACGGCAKTNRCVFADGDINAALDKMEACNALIIGSPVHYAAASGSITSFMDRFFYAGNCFALKPGAAIVSARRAGTTAALDQLNKYFTISQMPLVTSQYWNMVHGNNPDEVRQDAEGMQIMRTLGRNMAWLLKSIEAGKAAGLPQPQHEPRVGTNFIR